MKEKKITMRMIAMPYDLTLWLNCTFLFVCYASWNAMNFRCWRDATATATVMWLLQNNIRRIFLSFLSESLRCRFDLQKKKPKKKITYTIVTILVDICRLLLLLKQQQNFNKNKRKTHSSLALWLHACFWVVFAETRDTLFFYF